MESDIPVPSSSQVRVLSRPEAEEPTSCRECKRRRAKCDGTKPECIVCQKYRRHCLYDKHSRTRLTRKTLTILEERLERAEALLRSHFTEAQLEEMMNGAAATAPPATVPAPAPSASNTLNTTQPSHNLIPTPVTLPPGSGVPSSASQRPSISQSTPWTGFGEGLTPATDDTAGSYEIAPSVADDFEWDEQESSWSMHDSLQDAGEKSIMDGMASLSVGDRRGYLGSVSGAALLRQILSSRKDGDDAETGVPQHQLESLFQQHPDHSQWFRSQSMLTKVAVENLIDAFFIFYHPTFSIVHEPTFRAQYAGTLPRPDNQRWNTLANIIASLGSFASSNCHDATDLPIFQAAQKSLFADNLEVGNLTLVQAFALSATYLQKRNKPNTGYNYGGIALRLGIGLGLHKEFEGGNISPLQMEIRRRAWWVLCILDVGATITYGRPLNWPQAGVEAALPKNIHEEDLVSDSASYPQEVDGLTIYTYVRVQAGYHIQTMTTYNRLIAGPFPTASELISLDDKHIGGWLAQIPAYYMAFLPVGSIHALGAGITQWRYRNLRIVMYRPFLVKWALTSPPHAQLDSSSSENVAVFRCLDAAKETIENIEEYWTYRSHSRLAAWYVLYFLFHATLIPVHCLRHNPKHDLAPGWRSQIRSSLAVMGAMTDLSPNSAKCRDISLKLSWPHLQEGGSQVHDDNTVLVPNLGDGEAASVLNDYDAWCQLMSNTSTAVPPMYQWPNVEDQHLNFFY